MQAIPFSRQENVREDRDRGAALDDPLDQLEFLEHGRAVEGDVHLLVSRLLLRSRRIVQTFAVVVEGVEDRCRCGRGLLLHGLSGRGLWISGCGWSAEKTDGFPTGLRFSAGYRKCSMNVVRVASRDGLERRSSVIVSTEYMTVEWCLAKSFPISG